MNNLHDIEEDEIRVIGGDSDDGKMRFPWWMWVSIGLILIAVVLFLATRSRGNATSDADPAAQALNTEQTSNDLWHSNIDASLPSCVLISDTLVDSLHLRIFTPYNVVPELHIGLLDTTDTDIVLAAMAADLRRDNGKIVGAFVMAGEPLSWGLSKKGYCAIIDGRITLGVAENSPLFEQATEQGGYFFRQYPAVNHGVMTENNPENASFRRALCLLEGKVCIVACTDRVLMNDFSASLVKLGVSDAILLVGGTADGWCRTDDGNLVRLGSSYAKNAKFMNHIVFRKQ